MDLFKGKKVAILDGCMPLELTRLGIPEVAKISSSLALATHPGVVLQIHKENIDAGADIITTNNYMGTRFRLEESNKEDLFEEWILKSVELAKTAVENSGKNVLIAGCLPPLHFSYQLNTYHNYEECFEQYKELVKLMKSGVDLFLIEAMSDVVETKAAVEAVASEQMKCFIGWTVSDERPQFLRGGDKLADAIQKTNNDCVLATFINCSTGEAISVALDEVVSCGVEIFGAYANGFVKIPDGWVSSDGFALMGNRNISPQDYLEYVKVWLDKGARIIGGCCHIQAEHIQVITNYMQTIN